MPLKPPTEPIVRRGRPSIPGLSRSILFDQSLFDRIQEYRTFVKNKTGIHPNFTLAVRSLINKGLIEIGIPEDEPEDDEEDC